MIYFFSSWKLLYIRDIFSVYPMWDYSLSFGYDILSSFRVCHPCHTSTLPGDVGFRGGLHGF